VLGQIDTAHATFADLAEQLVLAKTEALMSPSEQLFSLPLGDEVLGNQQIGEAMLVVERGLAVFGGGFLRNDVSLPSSTRLLRRNRSTNLLVVTFVIAL